MQRLSTINNVFKKDNFKRDKKKEMEVKKKIASHNATAAWIKQQPYKVSGWKTGLQSNIKRNGAINDHKVALELSL